MHLRDEANMVEIDEWMMCLGLLGDADACVVDLTRVEKVCRDANDSQRRPKAKNDNSKDARRRLVGGWMMM